MADRLLPGLERRLKAEVAGGCISTASRGRYATDASHYQIMPLGVVTPSHRGGGVTGDRDLPLSKACRVTPRGGGSSQAGQTVNRFGHRRLLEAPQHKSSISTWPDGAARVAARHRARRSQPPAKSHGLWFPVDVSTASRATIGGMTGEQLLRRPLAALRQHARERHRHRRAARRRRQGAFRAGGGGLSDLPDSPLQAAGARSVCARRARGGRNRGALSQVQRRVGGYNIDALVPGRNDVNLAHILVGSEGTLAFSTAIEIRLSPVLGRRAVGACHFGSFHEAMAAAQYIVKLAPIAVELVDCDDDRARPRHRHVPADLGGVRAGPARGAAAGRVRRGAGRERAPAEAAARADGRSRHRLGATAARSGAAWSTCTMPSFRPRSPSFARPASTS